MTRPDPPPIRVHRPSTKRPAAAAGITKRQSRSPSRRGSVDASRKPAADAFTVPGADIKCVIEGRNENVSALFHFNSHDVVGRMACLTVVPALVIFSVTPPPE